MVIIFYCNNRVKDKLDDIIALVCTEVTKLINDPEKLANESVSNVCYRCIDTFVRKAAKYFSGHSDFF
jgi:hypothetical protein